MHPDAVQGPSAEQRDDCMRPLMGERDGDSNKTPTAPPADEDQRGQRW